MRGKIAHEYDDFYQAAIVPEDQIHFHHYVDGDTPYSKFRFKVIDDYNGSSTKKPFLITHEKDTRLINPRHGFLSQETPRESLGPNSNDHDNGVLEKPIKKLLEEIFDEILEQETDGVRLDNQGKLDGEAIPIETQLWTEKYMPSAFTDLLSDDKINREVLTWLKTWDETVFKRKKPAPSTVNYKQEKDFDNKIKAQHYFSKKTTGSYYNFDLEDAASYDILRNKMILLAGPPGSGKTTLARVLASHCGYNPIEINASDDRTANKLIEKVEAITQTENLQSIGGSNKKPALIILDEVDGTAESDSKGALKSLLTYIYEGKKTSSEAKNSENIKGSKKSRKQGKPETGVKDGDDDDGDDEDNIDKESDRRTSFKKEDSKNKEEIKTKRPIIFICNDPFAKGLKELRKKAIVFFFKKPDTNKLLKQLSTICKKENILISYDNLSKICEQNDNDIRSCLNTLSFLSLKKQAQGKSIVIKEETLIAKRELSKNLMEVLADIFHNPQNAPYHGNSSKQASAWKNSNVIQYCMSILQRTIDFGLLSEGLFSNYTKLKLSDSNIEEVTGFLESLSDADVLSKLIYRSQLFELGRYATLPAINLHINLAKMDNVRLEFPRQTFEIKNAKKQIESIVESLTDELPAYMLGYFDNRNFPTETLTFVHQLIQPRINNAILNDVEKIDLDASISIMLDFGIKLLSNPVKQLDRNGQEQVDSFFTPNIEKPLIFANVKLNQRLNEKAKILIQNNYEYVKTKRVNEDAKKEIRENQKNKGPNLNISSDVVKRYQMHEARKRKERPQTTFPFIYKYKEGYSNAVKYNLKMNYFFK